MQIADGLIEGLIGEYKFGRNPDVDSGNLSDIWDYGGNTTGQPIYVFPDSAGEAMTVSSDDANDTAAGTGAQSVVIFGLDDNFNIYERAPISLNGVSGVALPENLTSVHRVRVVSAGAGDKNAGNIFVGNGTITAGKPANIFAMVTIGLDQTLMTPYMVPADYTAFIYGWNGSVIRPPAAGSASLRFMVRPFGEVFQVADTIGLKSDGTNAKDHGLWEILPLKVEAKSQIKIESLTDSANFIVDAGYVMILRKN